ncbi:MAG: methyltransferase domain-containing protein [Pseudomonadota bacterium]
MQTAAALSNQNEIDIWYKQAKDDQGMIDDHLVLWDRMIDLMREPDMGQTRVLDYGCNNGGLLGRLHTRKPFHSGAGVDIATKGIENAKRRFHDKPFDFTTLKQASFGLHEFDIAVSHEVIYLLPDLEGHARDMGRWLKPGGRYYAATGCHTANPRWPEWRDYIAESANVAPQDYSPEDYVKAFEAAGFTAAVQPYQLDNFTPWSSTDPLFKNVMDALDFYQNHKLLFRFTAPAGPTNTQG